MRSELDSKASQCGFPISNGHRPFLANVAQRQIEEFQQRLVARERAAIFGDLAQAHIHRLDGIGRVNDFPDLRRIVKERDDP